MKRKGEMLDVVIQPVANVIADMSADPFRDVTLKAIQGSGQQTETQQQQSRADQHARTTVGDALVDHLLDDARHNQG